jgi:hypothetical protein
MWEGYYMSITVTIEAENNEMLLTKLKCAIDILQSKSSEEANAFIKEYLTKSNQEDNG